MFHDIFFGDATVTDMAFRTARFKQFTGNLQKCLEDLAKGRLAKAGLAKGGGVMESMFFFPPKIAIAIGVLCWGLCSLGSMLV